MEIADPSEPTAPAWGTFLLHMNLRLPALIGLVCHPWPPMDPHLYASSWPIHWSFLGLLTLRPVPHTHSLSHPWARSDLCHNRPLPSSHPGKPVGGVQLPPTSVFPAQVSPLSLGLQAADGGAAPSSHEGKHWAQSDPGSQAPRRGPASHWSPKHAFHCPPSPMMARSCISP